MEKDFFSATLVSLCDSITFSSGFILASRCANFWYWYWGVTVEYFDLFNNERWFQVSKGVNT